LELQPDVGAKSSAKAKVVERMLLEVFIFRFSKCATRIADIQTQIPASGTNRPPQRKLELV
jgi:hypothetical protein